MEGPARAYHGGGYLIHVYRPCAMYACEYLLREKDDSRELDIGIWVAIYRYSTVYV